MSGTQHNHKPNCAMYRKAATAFLFILKHHHQIYQLFFRCVVGLDFDCFYFWREGVGVGRTHGTQQHHRDTNRRQGHKKRTLR